MLYLAIDQHKHHLTINIRNEHGDVIQNGQVSTAHVDIDGFFVTFAKKARKHRGYMAIVEVCGFNDWLLEKLKKTRCSANEGRALYGRRIQQSYPTLLGKIQKENKVLQQVG